MAAIPISNTNFSEVTFAEAFASARAQLGFPAIFIHEGEAFHTGTKEEINSMSPEAWSDFSTAIKDTLSGLNLSSVISDFKADDQATVYVPENLSEGFQPDIPPTITELLAPLSGITTTTSKSLEEEIDDVLPSISAPMFTSAVVPTENGFGEFVSDSISGFFNSIGEFFAGIASSFSED